MASSDPIRHLRKDKTLKKLIDQLGPISAKKDTDLYTALLRAIVGQQLSVRAAATIWQRFLELFGGYPEPLLLLRMEADTLRSAGISYQKAAYLKNIADFSLSQTLDYKKLKTKTDDELIDYLVAIKGVGRWTVEMILMFSLDRPDVFPKDDLGIQNGIRFMYQIRAETRKELFLEMDRISDHWRPYRTLACMYLWRYRELG